ncbi:hypothetical protein [Lichenifustis flavocetrariae]|uniref:Uncharacterized protein n=1 Tax=Lichenifustis flavocetrariae TaxID=2949735 RepID=A0AA42CME7_9HYPH|nr:hypothetical protein [Lichenifustis flavocetrariae]MCW6508312.1 hypothetical protein [Lichenifustis flavocetrariae]
MIDTVTGTSLDKASAIMLQEFSLGAGGTSATSVGSFALPQTSSGGNHAISGEYGSASEGFLQQSTNGKYLTLMGYGVNAGNFNAASGAATYGMTALGQTTSLNGQSVTTVPRVVALIGGNGQVDTSTALTGVFNTNNPRSAATVDGSSFYVSGQGAKGDTTQGVFYATRGASTATAIDTSTDTRDVSIFNNTLYVSRDYNPPNGGNQNFTNVSSLTGPGVTLPTSAAGLVETHIVPPASPFSTTGGNNGSIDLTAGLANGVNNSRIGKFVYLSPEQYFFASPSVLYVADSGQPKNGNVEKAALGEGGLQKWVLTNNVWTLQYDLAAGLDLKDNGKANSNTPTAPGVTGLFGLTGEVVGNQVELFATSYGLNELSPSYLYEITDDLSFSTIAQAGGETFNTLYAAPSDVDIRGVSFAPVSTVPLPAGLPLFAAGTILLGLFSRLNKRHAKVG